MLKIAQRSILVMFLISTSMIVNCGGGEGPDSSSEGTLAIKSIQLVPLKGITSEGQMHSMADDAIDCKASGVSEIKVSIFDRDKELKSGTFDCEVHYGYLDRIPSGSNLLVTIQGKNILGEVVYEGEEPNIAIKPGVQTSVDRIVLKQKTECGIELYLDEDKDGYGRNDSNIIACGKHAGYADRANDCNDNDITIHPAADEFCGDGIDQNCDENDSDTGCLVRWFKDSDRDGFGDPENFIVSADQPSGYVLNNSDCRDDQRAIFPGAAEICDGVDNQCPGDGGYGQTDENAKCSTFENQFDMNFTFIKAGSFTMGSPKSEQMSLDPLGETQHTVTLTKDYYMQTTELTQQQWRDVVEMLEDEGHIAPNALPKSPSTIKSCGDNCPIVDISWNQAQQFIAGLNEMSEGGYYQLPTEAQWEYAAKAGRGGAYADGKIVEIPTNNYLDCYSYSILDGLGWYCSNSGSTLHPVMGKQPNPWGLYDMHGNVAEYCLDGVRPYNSAFSSEPVTDPYQPVNEYYNSAAHRGGSWDGNPFTCRSSCRLYCATDGGTSQRGFRLVYLPLN